MEGVLKMDYKLLLSSKFLPIIVGGILAAIVLAGGGYYFYTQSQAPKLPANQAQVQQEVKRLVTEVGKLIDLPTGEDPTVATVTDISKLQNQPFFQRAKNGDKVLIYTQARKAILYDPSVKKIIDVAPINIGSPSVQVAEPKVVLRNGTQTVGLTTRVESELKKSLPTINIVTKENAAKSDYEKTVVVVINDSGKDVAESLARQFNAEVGDLPEGESKPGNGDVLVILGKDRI